MTLANQLRCLRNAIQCDGVRKHSATMVCDRAADMLELYEELLTREREQHAEAQERMKRAAIALTNPL